MATSTWNDSRAVAGANSSSSLTAGLWKILHVLGSLKITVTMFALGIVILFVGTLAQDEQTLVDVKNDYFNAWISYIAPDVFLPITIFGKHGASSVLIPFPGGATIGFILLVNLIAAKLTRFHMQAKGGKLIAGLFFCVLGSILMGLIVVGAHRGDGLQGEPPFSYDFLWTLCQLSVWLLTVGNIAWVVMWSPKKRLIRVLSWILLAILLLCSVLVGMEQFRIPDPGLRITWQLAKSLIVGIVLLIGLIFLFGSRGGNVLIHLGVGLLMLGQFIFGDQQVEERITLFEGESTRVAYQLDRVELAFLESVDDAEDRVVSIDGPFLERAVGSDQPLKDAALPVDVIVKEWFSNHDIVPIQGAQKNLATAGAGLRFKAVSRPKFSAAQSEQVNLAGAYVTFLDKKSGSELGTYLVTQFLHDPNVTRKLVPEPLEVDGKKYQVQFRFKNSVKQYLITLDNVQRENYSGSMTPRDFSSDVRIMDESEGSEQKGHIWMNNPMRFRGESFYQSSYGSAEQSGIGKESTTLQVVTNAGWLIPYVSCVICGLGMLVHFGETFVRFAGRYERRKATTIDRKYLLIGAVAALVPLLYFVSKAMPPRYARDQFRWADAGKLPMMHEGRIKPLDTVARNLLLAASNRSKLYDKDDNVITATEWLVASMANADWTKEIGCIRIDAQEVLDEIGLKRREGHRYSFAEVSEKIGDVRAKLQRLDPNDREKWSFVDNKMAELSNRFGILEVLRIAYQPLVPRIPEEQDESSTKKFWKEIQELEQLVRAIEKEAPPAIIPPTQGPQDLTNVHTQWQAYGPAYFHAFEKKLEGVEIDRSAINKFAEMLIAVQEKNATDFNSALREYRSVVDKQAPDPKKLSKASWEAWYNRTDMITICIVMYLTAALVTLKGYLYWFQGFRTIGFWMAMATFGLHTIAIAMRIYLSDRPPVVNLYSSAVFIGWSVLLFGLVIEKLFAIGIGTLTGSTFGFLSLLVANGLDTSDTMPVLQAVLDTQFWLATHVTCITLGYGATFFAGAIGIVYLSVRIFVPQEKAGVYGKAEIEAIIDRIGYGVICFALFFSFIGTVLGGLWGDDSWGRFWGWDPKENGALMIVLWNALLIHARWDKVVRGRGFALLSVVGNIVTAWSWFGTNQLGIGLHSYGFNKSVLYWLAGFVVSQLIIVFFGWIFSGSSGPQTPAKTAAE